MANAFQPTVTVFDKTVELGKRKPIHAAFEVNDIDPDSVVTRYRFRDTTTIAQSGFFSLSGAPQQQGSWFEIDADLLHEVHYNSGAIVASETIQIQAFDGKFWSNASSGLFFSVVPNVRKPIATFANFDVVATETIAVTDLISAIDLDGYPITKYFFVDRKGNGNGGHFTLHGVRMASAKWFKVAAEDMPFLKYVGGQFGQNEKLAMQAFDGKFWSDTVTALAHTSPNFFNPVVTANNFSVVEGGSVSASLLFDFTDADPNTMKRVSFKDAGGNPNTGHFEVNGVAKAPNTWFTVDVNDLHKVKYIAGNPFTEELFRVQAWDGKRLSNVASERITTVVLPDIEVNTGLLMLDELEITDFSDLFTNSPGPTVQKYEVIDLNDSSTSAKVRVNGSALAGNVVHELTKSEFDAAFLQGGPDDNGRSYDNFQVRAHNGFGWSDWARLNVSTDPVNEEGVLDLGQWNAYNGQPVTVTYNFPAQVPYYYCDLGLDECGTFITMDPARHEAARSVMDLYQDFLNISFVEIPSSQIADIIFSDIPDPGDGLLGYAYIFAAAGLHPLLPGDIWITEHPLNSELDPDVGGGGYTTFLHEVGHALGLKHSFDGGRVLPPVMENNRYSMMSYTRIFGDVETRTPMMYDVMALQKLYGANTNFNPGDTQIRFLVNENVPQVIWDGGGTDSFNVSNFTTDTVINLTEGQFSSLGGLTDNVSVAYGAVIENARGGSGDDTIFGNDLKNLLWGHIGRDTLMGNGGDDVLRAGEGSDTYIYNVGADGYDIIDEQKLAGRDVIEFHGYGTFDKLEDDFSFRRLGRDLRIDLTVDRGRSAGGITITNMLWGGSRVETIKMFDVEGEQIGTNINLQSIFQVATTDPQRFMVTNNTSLYGNLATPV